MITIRNIGVFYLRKKREKGIAEEAAHHIMEAGNASRTVQKIPAGALIALLYHGNRNNQSGQVGF